MSLAPCLPFAAGDDDSSDVKRRTDAKVQRATFKAAVVGAELKSIEDGWQLPTLPNDAPGRSVFWPRMDFSKLFVRPVFRQFYERAGLLQELSAEFPLF
jgi:hypothetical protein